MVPLGKLIEKYRKMEENSTVGGGNDRSGLRGDQDLCQKEAEYGHIVYCNPTDSGPL